MKKIKEVWYCDRCHKELEEDELIYVSDYMYSYELCDDCKILYDTYKKAIKELDEKIDKVTKDFSFGRYLPREDENEQDK